MTIKSSTIHTVGGMDPAIPKKYWDTYHYRHPLNPAIMFSLSYQKGAVCFSGSKYLLGVGVWKFEKAEDRIRVTSSISHSPQHHHES